MIFVIGKDVNEAEKFIADKGICKKQTRHVLSPLSFKGRPRGTMYIRVGRWFERDDIDDIISELNKIKAVEVEVKS